MNDINTAYSISVTFTKGSTFKAVRKISSVITKILPSHNFCYEGWAHNKYLLQLFLWRLEWLGHVIRMHQIRMTKKIISHKPESTWKAGGPKRRLLGKLPNNIPVSKIKRCKKGQIIKNQHVLQGRAKLLEDHKQRGK
jgi:hypothetical protein